jgi:hypothetical protein
MTGTRKYGLFYAFVVMLLMFAMTTSWAQEDSEPGAIAPGPGTQFPARDNDNAGLESLNHAIEIKSPDVSQS